MRAAVAPLVGRSADLRRIIDAAMTARAGTTSTVLVTGEAGIGKTRLVAEAVAGIPDALVITGHAAEMSTGEIAFGVLADTLRDLTRVAGPDALTTTERVALAPLLPGAATGTAGVDRMQLLSAFADVLERLSTQRLLVWVVEDLHWADSATRDAVTLVTRTLHGSFLLVATVRTADPDRTEDDDAALSRYVAGLARAPGCDVLPLQRLTEVEVREQLMGLLGSHASARVAGQIEELSDGIPFVVEELAAAAGRTELSTASSVAGRRLTGLDPDARRLVEAAAVGEGHLRISLIEQVADATAAELDGSLLEAVRAGILVTDHDADAVGFRHALLRDATIRGMGPGARRAWHRRWAEVLESNPGVLAADPCTLAVAEHWHQAGDVRRALATTVAAMPAAERVCLPDEELVLWTRVVRAFGTLDDAAEVCGLSLRQVYARAVLSGLPGSRAAWLAFLAAVPVDQLNAQEELFHRDSVADTAPKGEAAMRLNAHALEMAEAFADAPPDILSAIAWASAGSCMTADPARGEALIEQARDAASRLGNPRAILAVASIGSYGAQVNGRPQFGVRLIDDAIQATGDLPWNGVLMLLGNLAWCEIVDGHYDRAEQVRTHALGRLPRPHLAVDVWEHLVENAAALWTRTGEWARARALLEEAAPWWDDDLRSSNARLDLLDLLQAGRADVSRWIAHLDDGAPGGAPLAAMHDLIAREHDATGDLPALRAGLAPMWHHEHVVLSDDELWETLLVAARAEAGAALSGAHDDRAEAEAHMRLLQELAARFRKHGVIGEAWPLDLAAQLDRFHGRDPRPALAAALQAWDRVGHVPDVAVTHLSLADAHAAHGDREGARRHLVAGREIAERLEAGPMLARAAVIAETYALAVRERRTTDVLTEREAEVLALLAEGRTNAEIASTLVMSPKTASVHVSHIIAKLGAANRTEAAATARRHGLLQ